MTKDSNLRDALKQTLLSLSTLAADYPDSPDPEESAANPFNQGGHAYEACHAARSVLDALPKPVENPITMVCRECGSGDVRADAYAEWDDDAQVWQIFITFDKGAFCNACDGETRLEEKPLPAGPTTRPDSKVTQNRVESPSAQ